MSKNSQLVLALLCAGTTAFAQADTASTSLDPVILTANKLPQKQSSTGKVVALITKEQVEKSGGETLSQLLNKQAGITVNGALNNLGTDPSLFLRGASAGRTLILIDGIPVYDPSVISNEFDLNLVSLNNVESIEICRGAQSTLYGSDAVAGVVNVITSKQSVTKPFALRISGSAGSYATYRGSVDVSGKTQKLTYSVKYSGLFSRGFSTATDSTNRKNFDRDGFRGNFWNAAITYQVAKELSLKGFVQSSANKSDLDAAAFADETDYSFQNKALLTGGSLRYAKNAVNLVATYQYSANARTYLNDSLDVPGFTRYSKNQYHGRSRFLDVYSRIDFGHGFRFLQGADYRYNSMNSVNFSLSAFGPYQSELKDTAHSQASLYNSLFFTSRDQTFNVDIGGRLNVHSQYGTNGTFTVNPSRSFNGRYRLLGSVASAFKAPTLYQLYSAYGNRSLQPEKSTTYELGLEQTTQKIFNRIVFFQQRVRQGIDFNYVTYRYVNVTAQVVRGLELESKIEIVKNATISLNYTFLNARESAESRTSFKDTAYRYLLRRPAHNLNLEARYRFTKKACVRLSGKYVSKRYDAGAYKAPDVVLAGYFLLNAYADYTFEGKLRFFADAQNLTNRKFVEIQGYNSIPFLFSAGFAFSL